MPKWLKLSCFGCAILTTLAVILLIGGVYYLSRIAKQVVMDIGGNYQIGIERLQETNGKYAFQEPDKIEYEGERFVQFLMARKEWIDVMVTKLPIDRLKALEKHETRPGFWEIMTLMQDVLRAMGTIYSELAEVLDRRQMSYAEFRWHTGQLLAALSADPVVTDEIRRMYEQMREKIRNINTGDMNETQDLSAYTIKNRYGFQYDPAKSSGTESLAQKQDLIFPNDWPVLLLDIYALKASLKPGEIFSVGAKTPAPELPAPIAPIEVTPLESSSK